MSAADIVTPPASSGWNERRHDLDWIRVAAFLVLILYHVGMFYVPWDWHAKSTHVVPQLEPIMRLTSPWRLTLLFFISGAATRFVSARLSPAQLSLSRVTRLLPPLLFAMFVVVPPQAYVEIAEQAPHLLDAPWTFYTRYATASGNWCDADGCLITPTWNHMWFVAYLLIYSLILGGLLKFAKPVLAAAERWADTQLTPVALFLVPVLYLAIARLLLSDTFEVTFELINDWYNHAQSFAIFLFGFLTVRSERVRQSFISLRWTGLVIGLAGWAIWNGWFWGMQHGGMDWPAWTREAIKVVYAFDQWGFIVAILGFGARHITRGGPLLRYLSVGVFPFYIVHQTVTVVVGHNIAAYRWPVAVEAGFLAAATAMGCWLAYEIARRIGPFGALLGVRQDRLEVTPRQAG